MKSALLSKIAMCVCPPAIVATSAVTVPPVKRAVHRLTAPRAAPAVARAHPRKAFTAAYDCVPTAVPLANAPLTNDLVAPQDVAGPPSAYVAQAGGGSGGGGFQGASIPGGGGGFGGGGGGPFYPGGPDTRNPVQNIGSSDVPEASTWIMTIGGFGVIGWALRRNRRKPGVAKADPA